MLKSIQHFAYIAALMAALALLASCTGGKKRYVIGVSQCSEDVWRENSTRNCGWRPYTIII